MENLLLDLRYALRAMRTSPAFTIVAMLTLGLGIGANTAIFSVVNGVLLSPLPYSEPERLHTFRSNISYPNAKDVREQSRMVEEVGIYSPWAQDLTGDHEPVRVDGSLVNGGFFAALGVQPLLGRVLSQDDDISGGPANAVISHSLWRQHFAADANILGKKARFSDKLYTIVGVMPPDFAQPRFDADVWLPASVVYSEGTTARGASFFVSVIRLKPDVTLTQAQAEIDAIGARLAAAYPDENQNRSWLLMGLQERMVGQIRTALLVLLAAAGLVLLVACSNFANLLLVRSAARVQEVAVRAALGASRARLVRQFVTESVAVSLLGGALGLLFGYWGVDVLRALGPADLPRLEAIRLDARVLAFTFSLSLLTGILIGLFPALRSSRTGVYEALKEGGRTTGDYSGRRWLRASLVVAEVGMALMLLIGAGLLIRSFYNLQRVELGFDPQGLITFRINLPQTRYNEIPRQNAFWRAFLERAAALPGVESVATISELPLSGNQLTHNMVIEGQPVVARGQTPEVATRTVSPHYFDTMRMRMLRGRGLEASDTETSAPVAVVNESFARQYFAGSDPIGKQVRWEFVEPPQWMTIVGVVGDVRHDGLDQPQDPTAYTTLAQNPQPWKRWAFVVVRPRVGGAEQVLGGIKQALWSVDPQLPLGKVQPMPEVVGEAVAQRRFNMLLLVLFAALALTLAVVGIYGVMSYSVVQRSHEIGIRMALGAQRLHVARMVLGQGMLEAAIGLGAGIAGAVALTRIMRGMLFGVEPIDPVTFVVVTALLLLVAVVACLIPARRATRVDPMVALRYE